MNKVIKALLQAKYPLTDADLLMEVINATPNATIACEILCGLYEGPVIPELPANVKNFNNTLANIKFVSYDKFNDQVNYSYNSVQSASAWVINGMEVPSYSEMKEAEDKQPYYASDFAKKLGITEQEFKTTYTKHTVLGEVSKNLSTSNCSLSNWLKN